MLRNVRQFSSKANEIKVFSRDTESPVSKVAVVVKAGARYEAPGTAHLLKNFAFHTSTSNKSGLRRWREGELVGGTYNAKLGRETITLEAQFLRTGLPHFVESVADVLANQQYKPHEYTEQALPQSITEAHAAYTDSGVVAVERAHNVAFRRGLGNPLYVQDYQPVSLQQVANFGKEAFSKSNVEIYASGVNQKDFGELVEKHLRKLGSGQAMVAEAAKFYSGESRVASANGNTVVLAFPSQPSSTNQLLANLLGGGSSVKWSAGQSPLALAGFKTSTSIKAEVAQYSDADLLYVTVEGVTGAEAKQGAIEAVKAIKNLASASEEQINRAVAQSKFTNAEKADYDFVYALQGKQVSFDAQAVKKTDLLKGPVVLSVVGNVQELPYLDELL